MAANVGGLYKNLKYKTEMFRENILINENIIIKYISFSNVFDTTATFDPLNKSTFNVDDYKI